MGDQPFVMLSLTFVQSWSLLNLKKKAYKFISKIIDRMGLEEVVTFLIPTLNERDGIGLVIDEIKSLGFNKIIVVD